MTRIKENSLGSRLILLLAVAVKIVVEVNGENVDVFSNTIRVSIHGNDSEECWQNESYPCESIAFAMSKKDLNYTRIVLEEGTHNLSAALKSRSLEYFSIEGSTSSGTRPSIHCTESNAGIIFSQCHQINLVNFRVENCGTKFPSTNVDNRDRKNKQIWNVSTALHIEETTDLNIYNLSLLKSVGYGAVFYDVVGNVTITSTLFAENRERNSSTLPGYASGGGMYIEFRPNCIGNEGYLNSGSSYTISKCHFIRNIAEHAKSIPSYSNCNQFISFGRGGGISFFSRGYAKNNKLTIIDCHFEGNRAFWGGGVFAEFDNGTGSNNIIIENSLFVNNQANLGGGGVRVGINSELKNGPNTVLLRNSQFLYNYAQIGGGFAQYRSSGAGKPQEKVTIDNCTFSSNVADRGAAINLILVNVDVINTTVEGHVHAKTKKKYQGEGATYFYDCSLTLIDLNTFSNNDFTAIVLDTTQAKHSGYLLFQNNTAMDGGGIGIYGDSLLLMVPKSTLKFENNTAKKRGGAIYVEKPISSQIQFKSTELKMRCCFILFGNDVTDDLHPDHSDTLTYFIGNRAPDSFGSNIFADTIADCRRSGEPLYNNSALRWKVFKYIDSKYEDGRTTVVTDPVIIKKLRHEEWSVYPGLPFSPSVVLFDENYNSVFGNIRVKLTARDNGKARIHGPDLFLVRDKIDLIRFDGATGGEYSVRLETASGPAISKTLQELAFRKCPVGYYFDKKALRCVCLSQKFKMHLGVTKCDADRSVYILNGRWGDTSETKDVDFAVHICPNGYCNSSVGKDTISHKFVASKQCADGRDENSVLCGSCESDKSVCFGNEECCNCPNNYGVLWLLLVIVVLTVVVLLVILVNADTYASSLNAFLYSYQIIPLCTHGNTTLDIFIKIVIALSTVSGVGGLQGVCLWKNMNDLQKIALNYIIPTYLIICLFIIYKLSYYFSNQCFLNRNSAVIRGFVFISVLAYSDFTRITFDLLHAVKVREKWVVYKAGFAGFFEGSHIAYGTLAIIVAIFIVSLWPLMLIFSHVVIRIPRLERLRFLFDCFNDPFRRLEVFDIFCSFYFLTRVLLLSVYIFMPDGTAKDTLFAVISIAILLVFVYVKPYTADSMNIYDSILLMNLAVLAVINLGLNGVTNDRQALQATAHALAYVPIACAIVKLAIWCKDKYQRRNRNGNIRG